MFTTILVKSTREELLLILSAIGVEDVIYPRSVASRVRLSQIQEKGHIAKVCCSSQVSKAPMKPKKTHFVNEECTTTVPEEQVDEELYNMCTLRDKQSEPIIVY